ncbi:MAG TPA: translation initiation factor IF-1 [Candidatus Paceibacterota bacterium]|nr:translation initiation factor IF-1 [Verrucomicrobiota bacterium]HSA11959.1 translation initiation factor IF-1 [Candidatus Paceibacterota bacterium]
MARESAIEVEGAVVAVLPRKMYRVELSNGHRLLAYVAGKGRLKVTALAPGDNVRLEVWPYDLSVGRIVVNAETNLI